MSERDGDDEIDDASLSSMRSVWLSMRDEEPPAAGMSALMAAAAAKATELRAEQPSWWQRALAQLRRPPALAFATVLLLVGGAVLVTRNEDTMKVEETATPELRVQDRVVEPVAPPVAGNDAPVTEAPPADPPKNVTEAKPRPKAKAPRKDVKMTFDGDEVGPNEPSRDERFEEDKPAPVTSAGGTSVETAPGMVGPEGKKSSPRPPVETQTTLSDAPAATPREQLARQAESAATRGDCAAVRAIAARLRSQDEAFFKVRLGKNTAVTKCLP